MSSKPFNKPLIWIAGGLVVVLVALVGALVVMFASGCRAIPGLVGCAVVQLPEDSLSADFYEGDRLMSAGTNSITLVLFGGQSKRINVRKITDNAYTPERDFFYDDTMLDVVVPAGETKTIVVDPPKDYTSGKLLLTCNIQSGKIGDDVACHPSIDGRPISDLGIGKSETYPLELGPHSVHIDLVGSQADTWYPESHDETFEIVAGQSVSLNETFTRKTLLTVDIDQKDVLGDLFLDGKLIGDQVSSAEVYVQPNESYTIVGSNFSDKDANGIYRWNTVGVTVHITSETEKTVTLPMDREELAGVVTITCHLAGFTSKDAVACEIPVDGGEPVTTVKPDQPTDVKVKPGVHTLTVKLTGVDSNRWAAPGPQRITVRTGETTEVKFTSVLLADVTPTLAPPPTSPPRASIPTLTPPPGSTSIPTMTPKPPSIYTGTLSNFSATARAIFQRGVALGRDPKKFSKVGDCETDSPYFLIPFDSLIYNLGSYRYLDPIIKHFAGSFGYHSLAGRGSFVAASVLDPQWSDPTVCQAGVETPLACEYRTHNPAIALIMLRTYPYPWETADREKYISDLRAVLDYTISQGIVPVISTNPLIELSPEVGWDMNNIIRQLAAEYNIPLWDFYATLTTLPNNGLKEGHLTVPPDFGTTFTNPESMSYGMTHRNLETLEVLHYLYTSVMK